MSEEEWLVITEFPDYAVSACGRVQNMLRGNILRPRLDRYSYLTLYRAGKPYVVLVHRLVCAAFHGEPPSPAHEVAHSDGNAHNNNQNNLRWATRRENEADKIIHGTNLAGRPSSVPIERRAKGATHGRHTQPHRTARGERARSKLTEKDVREIREDVRPRKVLAAEYGVSRQMIGYIQRGDFWAHIPTPKKTGGLT